ncbi:MAG: phosphoglycerate dehydrogenase [Acidimicrobiales bacterium]|nr:phosphoglycerate dehydrogenase [Acidimicrobiales bacterium]
MARILVTEKIAESGLDMLREAGHEVDVQLDLDAETLLGAVPGAAGLIIRSATQVTAEVLTAGTDLVVVGRAGIGLDNVDVAAATGRAVMVANAPESNMVSAAEQTMALLLATARNVPQAHAALKDGRWERSKWVGVELLDKTLGIVGLGRIGKLVAQRAAAFGMRLIAYDPYVSPERAEKIDVELVELDELMARSDFVTLHLAKTPETVGLIDAAMLAKAKPSMRIVNVARGGIIDEDALADAVSTGVISGAGIDVFATEPCTESPLFALDNVVVTPHLGASTAEAQDKAGVTIAEQVRLALAGEFVPFAVNVDVNDVVEAVRPFVPLAERLGAIFGAMVKALPDKLEIDFQGEIGGYDNKLTALALIKGLLGQVSDEPVSYVNAMQIAGDRGIEVRVANSAVSRDYVNTIYLQGGGHSLAGTLVGPGREQRLVLIDDHALYLPPTDHLLIIRNEDVPGMIGILGTALGDAGVNIEQLDVGQSPEGVGAVMAVACAGPVPDSVQEQLRAQPGIVSVIAVDLD